VMNDSVLTPENNEGMAVEGVSVMYGKIPAVNKLSLKVIPGEIVVLVGHNSAGKTSVIQAVATRSRWTKVTGSVFFYGERIDGLPTRERWARGLRLVPQGRQIFPSLDVEENLRVVSDNLSIPWKDAINRARELFPQIFRKRTKVPAGNLSGGEQQMLALARVLIGKPRILLLDEPGLGLARAAIRELVKVIEDLSERGIGILVADQGVESWVKKMVRAYVMVRGEIAGETLDSQEVEALLGITKNLS